MLHSRRWGVIHSKTPTMIRQWPARGCNQSTAQPKRHRCGATTCAKKFQEFSWKKPRRRFPELKQQWWRWHQWVRDPGAVRVAEKGQTSAQENTIAVQFAQSDSFVEQLDHYRKIRITKKPIPLHQPLRSETTKAATRPLLCLGRYSLCNL